MDLENDGLAYLSHGETKLFVFKVKRSTEPSDSDHSITSLDPADA
jgi:hypothetical protein